MASPLSFIGGPLNQAVKLSCTLLGGTVVPLFSMSLLPSVSFGQGLFTCGTDPFGEVCNSPPTIIYGVFAPAGQFYGSSREEACLEYAASVPNPSRGPFGYVAGYGGGLNFCAFQFGTYANGDPYYGIDGDNREVKTCPVNSVMYDGSGQYWPDNWIRPGALYLSPPGAGSALYASSTLSPSRVKVIWGTYVDYNFVTCNSRSAPDPARSFTETCNADGNPIHRATGVKSQIEIDYQVHGLRFVRTYNSGAGAVIDGPLGKGWQHTHGSRVNAANTTSASRPNGRFAAFAASGSNWVSWPDLNDRLYELKDLLGNRTGWKYVDAATKDTEFYDLSGKLISIVSLNGSLTTLSYSDGTATGTNGGLIDGTSTPLPRSRLIRASDQFGKSISMFYNANARLARLVLPGGEEIRYFYSATGNLTSVAYPAQTGTVTRAYLYENATFVNALTGIVDEKSDRHSTYGYDTVGRANSTELAVGVQRYQLAFNAANSTTVTDPLLSARIYSFNNAFGFSRVASQSQPAGSGCGPSSSAITYDAQANVSGRTDFNNNKVCYAYDLSRNLETKRVEGVTGAAVCSTALSSPPAGSRATSTAWHPDWRLETRIAEPKKLTTITYNGQGATCAPSTVLVDGKPPAVICTRTEQATTDETGASGFAATVTGTARTWRYTYTTYGRVLTATDPNNRVTTTSYHPDNDADLGKRGNVASITNAANHTTHITNYNPHGQPTRVVDPNGVVTTLTYDPRMRLTSRTVGNEATVFGYDPVGQMTSVSLPDGARLTYTYDAAHRLTAINDHKGNRIDYTLDAMGNRINEKTKDPSGVLVGNIARVIDALNRVERITGAVQ